MKTRAQLKDTAGRRAVEHAELAAGLLAEHAGTLQFPYWRIRLHLLASRAWLVVFRAIPRGMEPQP